MDLKKYFDADLRTTIFFTVFGVIAGYASFISRSNLISIAILLVFLGAGRFLMQRVVKEKKDMKWWLGNGMIVCIFTWFVVWTIFYNVLV